MAKVAEARWKKDTWGVISREGLMKVAGYWVSHADKIPMGQRKEQKILIADYMGRDIRNYMLYIRDY